MFQQDGAARGIQAFADFGVQVPLKIFPMCLPRSTTYVNLPAVPAHRAPVLPPTAALLGHMGSSAGVSLH